MNCFKWKFPFLALVLHSNISHSIDLSSVQITDADKMVESESSSTDFQEYYLNLKDKTLIGSLRSIAGEPRLVEFKSLQTAKDSEFEIGLLRYDAGTAGTNILMQMDRVAIVFKSKSQNNWKILGDHAISLRRYQGIKALLELERNWKWETKHSTLKLDDFDDEPGVLYTWSLKDKAFIRKQL